eukprot:5540668-Alexandrium_andersonii.AAC.1
MVLARGRGKAGAVTRARRREGTLGWGQCRGLIRGGQLTITKAAEQPAIVTFARSRAWAKQRLDAAQRVANMAVRRGMG